MESESNARYEAAESMLQHSRLSRTQQQAPNGSISPQGHPIDHPQSKQPSTLSTVPISPYPPLRVPLQTPSIDQGHSFSSPLGGRLVSSQDLLDQRPAVAFSAQPKLQAPDAPITTYRQGLGIAARSGAELANANPLVDGSELASSNSPQDFLVKDIDGSKASGRPLGRKGSKKEFISQDGNERPPPWSELKTKAGKERKRLPLACIACRRKKIRCSGEKPACKHCLRSRIPCVYKVTTRKAAPRTDYMAMLDKRLKRMEERVIKIIPEEETGNISAIGRANVRPIAFGHGSKAHSGKKRAAEEAFGPDIEEWTSTRTNKPPVRVSEKDDRKTLVEGDGANKLPSKELQEHLAEVFFDYLYGQSYLLLHKPSFMRRLRCVYYDSVRPLATDRFSGRALLLRCLFWRYAPSPQGSLPIRRFTPNQPS